MFVKYLADLSSYVSSSCLQVSTFQVVLAGNKTDTFALFLYAEDGLQSGRDGPGSGAELRVLAGFSRGDTSSTDELYYSLDSPQQSPSTLFQ